MFDNVDYECICPNCHSKVDGFQSKSGDCVLDTLTPVDVDNFYTNCRGCGAWIEFTLGATPFREFDVFFKLKNAKCPVYYKTVQIEEDELE